MFCTHNILKIFLEAVQNLYIKEIIFVLFIFLTCLTYSETVIGLQILHSINISFQKKEKEQKGNEIGP